MDPQVEGGILGRMTLREAVRLRASVHLYSQGLMFEAASQKCAVAYRDGSSTCTVTHSAEFDVWRPANCRNSLVFDGTPLCIEHEILHLPDIAFFEEEIVLYHVGIVMQLF